VIVFKWMILVLPVFEMAGQTQPAVSIQVHPKVAGRSIRDGQVTTVYLAPRYATAIRMPEAVNSVVVGDPGSFSAEHSDREPQLVFVKPITPKPAQTNLLISTTRGLQVSLLLVSRGEMKGVEEDDIDFLMPYKPSGQFIVQPAATLSAVVPQTAALVSGPTSAASSNSPIPVVPTALRTSGSGRDGAIPPLVAANSTKTEPTALDDLLDRQRRAPLPTLYGQKPGVSPPGKELIRAGVSEVIDQGTAVVVLFSALNAEDHPIELMPPQVQLGGVRKTGKLVRRSRWTTAEQLPVTDFRMSRSRLGPGQRADGVVVFQRPSFKQANETLFVQMAESGAVDRPALAPIGFQVAWCPFAE
jgi:hypothetical protein